MICGKKQSLRILYLHIGIISIILDFKLSVPKQMRRLLNWSLLKNGIG